MEDKITVIYLSITINCLGQFYNKVQQTKQRKDCSGYSENIYLNKGDYETVVENKV